MTKPVLESIEIKFETVLLVSVVVLRVRNE